MKGGGGLDGGGHSKKGVGNIEDEAGTSSFPPDHLFQLGGEKVRKTHFYHHYKTRGKRDTWVQGYQKR